MFINTGPVLINTAGTKNRNKNQDFQKSLANSRRCTTSDEFSDLASKFLQGYQKTEVEVLATLKRSVVMIFEKHGLYLRLPDQDPEAIIHRINTEDIHLDTFLPRDWPYYAKYKIGMEELPPMFAADIALRQQHLTWRETRLALGKPT